MPGEHQIIMSLLLKDILEILLPAVIAFTVLLGRNM